MTYVSGAIHVNFAEQLFDLFGRDAAVRDKLAHQHQNSLLIESAALIRVDFIKPAPRRIDLFLTKLLGSMLERLLVATTRPISPPQC